MIGRSTSTVNLSKTFSRSACILLFWMPTRGILGMLYHQRNGRYRSVLGNALECGLNLPSWSYLPNSIDVGMIITFQHVQGAPSSTISTGMESSSDNPGGGFGLHAETHIPVLQTGLLIHFAVPETLWSKALRDINVRRKSTSFKYERKRCRSYAKTLGSRGKIVATNQAAKRVNAMVGRATAT